MINTALDNIEWVLLVAFFFSAFNLRIISLLMMANIGLGMALYDWFLTMPDAASSAIVTLINIVTILLILKFGEKSVQKPIQSVILLGFIGVDAIYLAGGVYESFEAVLLSLYAVMFLTIIEGAGRGARYCIQPDKGSYSGGHSGHDSAIHRDRVAGLKRQAGGVMEEDS